MQLIQKYFPDLNSNALQKLSQLKDLYTQQNAKVNLVSRKDIDQLYLHHVLHSLSLVKFVQWNPQCRILDLGTGGGFPAIPLAIYFPEIQFTAIDGTGKKIKAVKEIAATLELNNLNAQHLRAEDCKQKFHFVVSRGVTTLSQLCAYGKPLLLRDSVTALPNGIIAYKGGQLDEEFKEIRSQAYYELWRIFEKFPEVHFIEKYLVYMQLH